MFRRSHGIELVFMLLPLSFGLAAQSDQAVDATAQVTANGVPLSVTDQPSATPRARLIGNVQRLDAGGKGFSIAGLDVRLGDATDIVPAGASIAPGMRVAVFGAVLAGGRAMAAATVVIKRETGSAGDHAMLGGVVRSLNKDSKTFNLDGFNIDAAHAEFQNGTPADLVNGRAVRIRGNFVNGLFHAVEVRFVPAERDARADLTGVITDFHSLADFKVRGVAVDGSSVRAIARDDVRPTAGDLVNIRGYLSGSVFKATAIERIRS